MALAHIITDPEKMPLQARGRETRKNVCQGEAPRVRATFSILTSTALKASLEESMRKGTLTNIMAMTTPASVSTKGNPHMAEQLTQKELPPEDKEERNAGG